MLIDVCFDDLSDLIYVNKCCICLCYNCYESASRQNAMCCRSGMWNKKEVINNFDWLSGSQ
jgi:hypothetical protein